MMSTIVLDHVFFFGQPGGPEAALLHDFGLAEGMRRDHPGQGTSNVCYFLDNAYVELIWIADVHDAGRDQVSPLGLLPRSRWRNSGACPFGICVRPRDAQAALPFDTWDYRPSYVPFPIRIATDPGDVAAPLVFALPADRPSNRPVIQHPGGFRELTHIELHIPALPRSNVLEPLEDAGLISCMMSRRHHMEVALDHCARDRQHSFKPDLPLSVRW